MKVAARIMITGAWWRPLGLRGPGGFPDDQRGRAGRSGRDQITPWVDQRLQLRHPVLGLDHQPPRLGERAARRVRGLVERDDPVDGGEVGPVVLTEALYLAEHVDIADAVAS